MAHMVAAHGNIRKPIMFVQLYNIIIASNSFLNFDLDGQSANEMIGEIVEMNKKYKETSESGKDRCRAFTSIMAIYYKLAHYKQDYTGEEVQNLTYTSRLLNTQAQVCVQLCHHLYH